MPTDEATASFEAGIKFGALFHQFIGTPVSPESAASLEVAIQESIENQPYCESVDVAIDRDLVAADAGPFGYTGLLGKHLSVEVEVAYEGVEAHASMAMEDGYPMMRLDSVE